MSEGVPETLAQTTTRKKWGFSVTSTSRLEFALCLTMYVQIPARLLTNKGKTQSASRTQRKQFIKI